MELFSIPCSTCGAKLKVKSLSALGQIFNCPKCQSMVLVESPPGWKPPPKPSPVSAPTVRPVSKSRQAAAAAIPEALEVPVGTLLEPGDSTAAIPLEDASQLPVETGSRHGLWMAGAALGLILLGVAAWTWWPDSTSAEALVSNQPIDPPAPVAEPPVEPAVEPIVDKSEPQHSPTPGLPRRWMPADTRLVLSLPLSDLAKHEAAPEVLASGSSPLRQTLSDLRTTFHVLPEQIRQLTWAATSDSSDLRDSLVVIELSQPLEDDAALLAGCTRTDLELADAVCHEPAPGGWPHPFAIVDPSTIVSGPRELLFALSIGGETPLERAHFDTALAGSNTARCTLVIDVQSWTGWEQLQWPAAIEELLAVRDLWDTLKDTPQAASLAIDLSDQSALELRFLCEAPQDAEKVKLTLENSVADLPAGSHVSLESNSVTYRVTWPDDSRSLAAALLSSLPTWQAPPPPMVVAAKVEPPATAPVAPPIDAGQSPFERQVARRFDERIPAVALRGMKLTDFADFLSRLSGVPISVDEAALASAGIVVPPTIEVQLTAATIGEVLTAALAAHELDYVAQGNRLLITTRAKAKTANGNGK